MILDCIYEFVHRINPEITKKELLEKLCENEISAVSLAIISSKNF